MRLLHFARNDSLWHVYLFRAEFMGTLVQREIIFDMGEGDEIRNRLFERTAYFSLNWSIKYKIFLDKKNVFA